MPNPLSTNKPHVETRACVGGIKTMIMDLEEIEIRNDLLAKAIRNLTDRPTE
jgi:hypothetical protein